MTSIYRTNWMNSLHRSKTNFAKIIYLILLLPFFAVQLVGASAMPKFGPNGVEIVICAGDELKTLVQFADGSFADPEDSADTAHSQPCSWALFAASAVDIPVATLPMATLDWIKARQEFSADLLQILDQNRRPNSRGPPVLSV